MIEVMIGIVLACSFFMGASVFSFLNVLAYRMPRHMDFVKGHSQCTSCGHELNMWDMFPVLGYLFLGGRCRYCKAKISPRYMFVELIGGSLTMVSVLVYQTEYWKLFMSITLIWILGGIFLYDMDTMEIPNGFVLALLLPAILSIWAYPEIGWLPRVIGFFSISFPMLLLTLLIPGAFGGGDIKMMAVLGLALGWKLNLMTFLFGLLGGGAYGIYLLVAKKADKKSHFAFGPFLAVGVVLALFFGNAVITWYLGLLRL